MFHNVVAGVLTGVLDDQTDRDVIALAKELVAPEGKAHAPAPTPRHGQARPRLRLPRRHGKVPNRAGAANSVGG